MAADLSIVSAEYAPYTVKDNVTLTVYGVKVNGSVKRIPDDLYAIKKNGTHIFEFDLPAINLKLIEGDEILIGDKITWPFTNDHQYKAKKIINDPSLGGKLEVFGSIAGENMNKLSANASAVPNWGVKPEPASDGVVVVKNPMFGRRKGGKRRSRKSKKSRKTRRRTKYN